MHATFRLFIGFAQINKLNDQVIIWLSLHSVDNHNFRVEIKV